MRRLSGSILFVALTCMLCIQGLGLHLHIAEAGVAQEVELHQQHLNPVDLHARGHDNGLSHGHEHEGEVDVDISQMSSPVSVAKWLKVGFVPLSGFVSALPEFVACGVVLTPQNLYAPDLIVRHGLRPPLRAPPQSA